MSTLTTRFDSLWMVGEILFESGTYLCSESFALLTALGGASAIRSFLPLEATDTVSSIGQVGKSGPDLAIVSDPSLLCFIALIFGANLKDLKIKLKTIFK